MSLIGDIFGAYRDPGAALSEHAARGIADAQTLFYAMLFGFLNFVASLPVLSVQAGSERPLFALAAANLVVTLFVVPLVLFGFAGLCAWFVSFRDGTIAWITARRVVVWSALVAAPFVLIGGLLAPLVPGAVTTGIQLVTAFVFLRQLIVGLNILGLQPVEQN
jgi:hypothetical protein